MLRSRNALALAAAACVCGSNAAWRAREASHAHIFVDFEVLVERVCRRSNALADLERTSSSWTSTIHLPSARLIAFFLLSLCIYNPAHLKKR